MTANWRWSWYEQMNYIYHCIFKINLCILQLKCRIRVRIGGSKPQVLLCYSGGNGNVVKFSLNFKSLISKQTDFVFGNPKTLAVYVYGSVGMVSIYLCIQTPSYSQGLSLSRLQSLACTFFVLERSNLSG